MPNRFWTGAVNGGTGTWDTGNTANWSATTGGAGGASVPTTGDLAFFDANSGAGTCTLGSNVTVPILNLLGYTGTLDFSTFKIGIIGSGTTVLNIGATAALIGSKRIELTASATSGTRELRGLLTSSLGGQEVNAPDIFVISGTDTIGGGIHCRNFNFTGFSGVLVSNFFTVYGDLILSSTMTTSGNDVITFASTSSTPRNITTNGVVINFPLVFGGAGGFWELQDDLNLASNRYIRTNSGTFNANNKNLTIGGYLAGVGTKTINMGSGTWTLTGNNASILAGVVWNAQFGAANLTVIPGTATINMTSASAKTFAGAARTWPTLNQGGAGTLTIQQANTFANITNTVQPATITFPANTTTTVGAFTVSGTSGNLITLNSSTSGTRATLSDASGVDSVSFCDIKDINATGGAFWRAYSSLGNIDSGNNLGWDFNDLAFRYIYTRRKNKVILPL